MNENCGSESSARYGYNILVLDSGIGGLSICESILARCPDVVMRYVADDAAFPYGVKDEQFLIARLEALIAACSENFNFDLVVVACNTASTSVLPSLRAKFDLPFVGVVPAIKPAALHSASKKIGLLATPGTVSRAYTDALIRDFAFDCEVTKVGSSALVEQAERKLAGLPVQEHVLRDALEPFLVTESEIDTIVLGCTHFPFLRDELARIMPAVAWVDSGEAIARRVESLLGSQKRPSADANSVHQIMFTDRLPESTNFKHVLGGLGFQCAELSLLKTL